MADWDPAATWNREEPIVNDDEPTPDEFADNALPADELPTDEWSTDEWSTVQDETDQQVEADPEPATTRAMAAPIERFKKRRVVIGAIFLVLGLAGAIADLFNTSGATAFAMAGLVGSLALLGSLVLGARRNARSFSHTSI